MTATVRHKAPIAQPASPLLVDARKTNASRFDFCSFFVQATLTGNRPFQTRQLQSCELAIL
jgi:hypothetical protein